MKRAIKYISMLSVALVASSCYDDLVQDYTQNGAYFSYQNPLRTVIAERDGMDDGNAITVGCAIGGKTTVDVNDWVSFEVDESLITSDSGLVMMPEEYYTLSDYNTMTIAKVNNFIAQIDVYFTEAFFNDEKATEQYYALPFRATGTNLDVILEDQDYTVVAVKFISNYHGTYYIQGVATLLDGNGDKTETKTTYWNDDLSQNQYVDFSSISKRMIQRPAETLLVGDTNTIERAAFTLAIADDGTVSIDGDDIVSDSATATITYNGTTEACSFEIEYNMTYDGNTYNIYEIYTRRQDPLYDLTLDFWGVDE